MIFLTILHIGKKVFSKDYPAKLIDLPISNLTETEVEQ